MQTMTPDQYKSYRGILESILEDGRVEFLLTNDERDFLQNAKKQTHIHWPISWAEKLDDIAEKLP